MAERISYKTTSFLSKYIDRCYVFEETNFKSLPILPGSGLELLFHVTQPLSINNKQLEKAHTVCPREISCFDRQNDIKFISVRFKSGAFRHFTSIPFSILNNQYFSIKDLWGKEGEGLLIRLEEIDEIQNKIQEIEFFLAEIFNKYHDSKNDKWDLVIDELYYNFDSNTVKKMADKTNLSLRQFERSFKTQFGITAKEFQKITRFQDVVKKTFLKKSSRYLDVILENGYFDQSHFIKEFKSFTGKTPTEYFTKESFNNHFYDKQMKS